MEISENSRIWIYQANRPLTQSEEQHVADVLKEFTNQWQAHGKQLAAKAEIRYNRFIILMVDESFAGATGCSIDKSVHLLKKVDEEFNLDLFNRFNMAYKAAGEVISCSRAEFEKLLDSGIISEQTIVFNNLVQTVKDLSDKWEVPFRDSWHNQVFGNLIHS